MTRKVKNKSIEKTEEQKLEKTEIEDEMEKTGGEEKMEKKIQEKGKNDEFFALLQAQN